MALLAASNSFVVGIIVGTQAFAADGFQSDVSVFGKSLRPGDTKPTEPVTNAERIISLSMSQDSQTR
jgi:hypothetical protein